MLLSTWVLPTPGARTCGPLRAGCGPLRSGGVALLSSVRGVPGNRAGRGRSLRRVCPRGDPGESKGLPAACAKLAVCCGAAHSDLSAASDGVSGPPGPGPDKSRSGAIATGGARRSERIDSQDTAKAWKRWKPGWAVEFRVRLVTQSQSEGLPVTVALRLTHGRRRPSRARHGGRTVAQSVTSSEVSGPPAGAGPAGSWSQPLFD